MDSVDDIEIRPVTQAELTDFFQAVVGMFGDHATPEEMEPETVTAEVDRTLAGFDDGLIVATAGCYSFDLAVPGARLPAGGVSYVGVTTTHRRRGLLTRLMTRQLADIKGRGEPLAVLWASEAAIYGRFGYGAAVQRGRVEIDRQIAQLRPDAPDLADGGLTMQAVTLDAAGKHLREVLDRLPVRPGMFARDERWVTLALHDSDYRRAGASPMRCVVARRGEATEGLALYHLKPGHLRPQGFPDGEVRVDEQLATSPAAEAALTRFLMSIDLMRRVQWSNQPIDWAVPHLLTDVRRATTTVIDGLHVRVVDLPTALAGRRYATEVDVVLDVTDDRMPDNAGHWRLRGDRTSATCERTDDPAGLTLGIEALGAAYLGGTSLATLAEAGRVRASDPAVLSAATTAFGWDVRPWCPTAF